MFFVNLAAAFYHTSWAANEAWFEYDDGPPTGTRFRFGGRVFLPGVHGGAWLNVGEALDFLVGLAGVDMLADDGIPKYPPVRDA